MNNPGKDYPELGTEAWSGMDTYTRLPQVGENVWFGICKDIAMLSKLDYPEIKCGNHDRFPEWVVNPETKQRIDDLLFPPPKDDDDDDPELDEPVIM